MLGLQVLFLVLPQSRQTRVTQTRVRTEATAPPRTTGSLSPAAATQPSGMAPPAISVSECPPPRVFLSACRAR